MAAKTMFEKIWESHSVHETPGQPAILYVDLHLVHEVTSAQAFDGLRMASRNVRRPEMTVATMDHNVPTTERRLPIADPISRKQVEVLRRNCEEFGITLYDRESPLQGNCPYHRARAGPESARYGHSVRRQSYLYPRLRSERSRSVSELLRLSTFSPLSVFSKTSPELWRYESKVRYHGG